MGQIRLFVSDDNHKIFKIQEGRKEPIVEGYSIQYFICPLTGKAFKNRGEFWDYIKTTNIQPSKMKYDRQLNIENEENISKLFDITQLEELWINYFVNEFSNKTKFYNLIGQINLELYIILLKVYRGEMNIDNCINESNKYINDDVIEKTVSEELVSDSGYDSGYDSESNLNIYNFILGDCLEKLKEQSDKSIDLVVTSPPYNIGLKYNKYKDKKPREQYLEWIYDIFVELKRILKDDGHIFLNMGYTNKDPWISMEVALKLKELFTLQNNITWVKSISIGESKDDTHGHFKPINSDRYINVTNENLYHFTKTDKVKINREAIGVPYKWKCNLIDRKTGKHRINKKTGLPVEDKRCKGNTWFIPYETIWNKSQKGFHPATFPEGLVEHCIKISDVKKGVILDPFIGSGTTVRTAKKMSDNVEDYNLSGIGMDIDEKYITYCNESIVD
uniref:site-specific DNA-methyltransferase (cytosine-N(4)-specific) n=1 Tax=viral metagenome TaxID=1070528 RepID=A0A6C0CEF9_9ZZZZ